MNWQNLSRIFGGPLGSFWIATAIATATTLFSVTLGIATEDAVAIAPWGIGFLVLLVYWLTPGTNNDRRVLSGLTYVLWFMGYLARPPWGTPLAAMSILVGVCLATVFARSQLAGTNINTFQQVLAALVGGLEAPQSVGPPVSGFSAPVERLPGPRILTILNGAAALLEQGNVQRAFGPGRLQTNQAETVVATFRVAPLRRSFSFTDVLTQDIMRLRVSATMTVGIALGALAGAGQVLQPAQLATLLLARAMLAEWEADLRTLAEVAVRTTLGAFPLNVAIAPAQFPVMGAIIQGIIQPQLATWGLVAQAFTIITIEPEQEVLTVRAEQWLGVIRNQIMYTHELDRADAWADALNLISIAYGNAAAAGVPVKVIRQEIVRRLLEQAGMSPNLRSFLDAELKRLS